MPKKPKKTIHGQAKPIDTATAVLWKNAEYFAEVFNRIVFKKQFVKADNLKDASEVEATFLQVRKVHRVTLKTTSDVAKALYMHQVSCALTKLRRLCRTGRVVIYKLFW